MRKSAERIKKVLGNCFLISICLLVSSVAAFGEETKPLVPMHAFKIGVNLGYFDYEEQDFDLEWDGFMYGVIGSYTCHDEIMFHTSLEYTLKVVSTMMVRRRTALPLRRTQTIGYLNGVA
jgi:hypothetical protein